MTTTLFLSVIALSLLITINSDLERVYNGVSKFLFGNKGNICKY